MATRTMCFSINEELAEWVESQAENPQYSSKTQVVQEAINNLREGKREDIM